MGPPENSSRAGRPNRAIALWLVQLLFPTVALVPILSRLGSGHRLGIYSLILVGLGLGWLAGCLLALVAAGMRQWIRGHGAQLLAVYISCALPLVVVEAFCRYQAVTSQENWRRQHALMEYSPDLGWKLVPGKDGVGEHGWRGPYRTPEKPTGAYRIVCVGDSTTHGASCPWDKAWPFQLEALLNADPAWSAAHSLTEVVNLGVPAYGTDQELVALEKYGLAFHPDLVILHLCVNDFADVSYDHDWRMWEGVTRYKPFFVLENGELVRKRDYAPEPLYPAGKSPEKGWLAPYLVLWSKMDRILDNWENSLLSRDKNVWPIHDCFQAEYGQARPLLWALVREMARVSRQGGSNFLVTLSPTSMNAASNTPPWRVGSFLEEYQADAAAAGVIALSFIPEYFAEGGNARFRAAGDIYHLNEEGNALVARHTLRWLKAQAAAPRSDAR
jgi:lysophospholipase L1-like esterase